MFCIKYADKSNLIFRDVFIPKFDANQEKFGSNLTHLNCQRFHYWDFFAAAWIQRSFNDSRPRRMRKEIFATADVNHELVNLSIINFMNSFGYILGQSKSSIISTL